MSADIVEKSAEIPEISPPTEEVPALDRDEIRRKRRERKKQKREEIRKIKSLMKQQKVKVVSEKELDRMRKLVEFYEQNVVVKVDLLLEMEKAASALAATPAPAIPGIVRKTKPKGKGRYFRNKSKNCITRKINKGKKREVPKKRVSKLKKKLLQFRKEKKEKNMEIVQELDKLNLNTTKLPEAVKNPEIPKEVAKDAELSPKNAPKVVDEPMLDIEEELKEKADENHPASVYSRKFRPYCDNTTSKEICELTEKFLKKIFTYQKRAYEKSVIKGSAHRRYVYGFHEVKRQVEINKAKLVIIAPDCEPTEFPGGFDDIIKSLKDKCKERNIPYLFSIRRRSLAYSLFKKVPVSCVAVLNYDGAQELYQELMDTLKAEREKYKLYFEQNRT